MLAKRLADMEAMVSRIPGASAFARRRITYNYTDSQFVEAIAITEMPNQFTPPNMKMYDVTIDLDDHLASYK